MKRISPQFFLCSLVMGASTVVYAETEQWVSVPVLEGGATASVGTFYVTPSSDFETYYSVALQPEGKDGPTHVTPLNITPDYEFGIDASLGYIFEDTANSIELFFRNINTSDSDASTFANASDNNGGTIHGDTAGNLGYELNSFDLLISQFIDIGTHMQMRFTGGLAYVELEQDRSNHANIKGVDSDGAPIDTQEITHQTSEFTGWGPRIGMDSRYDFGQGIGIVGGGSMAYYLGNLDLHLDFQSEDGKMNSFKDNLDSHAVMNFRANLGVDYVYFFDNEDRSTLGLELGYLIDYYDDGIASANVYAGVQPVVFGEPSYTTAVSFSGPYVNLKGVF